MKWECCDPYASAGSAIERFGTARLLLTTRSARDRQSSYGIDANLFFLDAYFKGIERVERDCFFCKKRESGILIALLNIRRYSTIPLNPLVESICCLEYGLSLSI
jgi:hypothetical protein